MSVACALAAMTPAHAAESAADRAVRIAESCGDRAIRNVVVKPANISSRARFVVSHCRDLWRVAAVRSVEESNRVKVKDFRTKQDKARLRTVIDEYATTYKRHEEERLRGVLKQRNPQTEPEIDPNLDYRVY